MLPYSGTFPTKDYIGVADSDATYIADCMPEDLLIELPTPEDRVENQKVFCLRRGSNRRHPLVTQKLTAPHGSCGCRRESAVSTRVSGWGRPDVYGSTLSGELSLVTEGACELTENLAAR